MGLGLHGFRSFQIKRVFGLFGFLFGIWVIKCTLTRTFITYLYVALFELYIKHTGRYAGQAQQIL